MSAKTAEDLCNTETEERRKRSRRVSFAELTSVHVFDRDDESETPPEPKPSSDDPEHSEQSNERGLEFLRSQKDEKQVENDEDDLDGPMLFFQPFDSSSPGSTIGSSTSNDEDNFFGPVSASFIRRGRLSDSAASDGNHDITMDSTAFSMHFRSLARSDSGGDLKTPTGVRLSFEEKTPTQNTPSTNVGNSMVLTVAKPLSESSTSVDKLSGRTYSNDMSLVGQGPHRYDYGRLSPGLDALLAEGNKDMRAVSVSDNIPISKSIINFKSRFSPSKKNSEPIEPSDGRKKEMCTIDTADLQAEVVTFVDKKLDEANGGYNISALGHITYDVMSDMRNAPASDVSVDKSPNQLTKGLTSCVIKDSDTLEIRRSNLDFDAAICGTPSNLDNNAQATDAAAPSGYVSPLVLSMSSLSDKQRLMVLNKASSSQNLQITSPFQSQPSSFGLTSGAIKDSDTLEMRRLYSNFDAAICGTSSKLDSLAQQTDASAPSGYVSPSALSMSSLSDKRRLMVLNNASPSQNLQVTTPFQNKCGSFVRNLTRKQTEIESSIQKSISKLKMLSASPFSSALKVNNDSTTIPLDIFKTTMYNTVLDRDREDVQIKCVDTSVACFDDQLFVGATENGELKSLIKMDASDIDSSENYVDRVMELVAPSPSRKEHPNATHNDRLHSFVVEEIPSPNCNYLTDSFGNFHVRKRRREDTRPGGSSLSDEIARIGSPDHHRNEIDSKFLSQRPNENNTETSTAVRKERLEHWADVFSKFSADAKQLFSPSTDKLTLQAIGELEDVLVNLRRVQIYDMLSMEIRSQKSSHTLSNSHYRRFEMKQLLHRFVYEQAKLQLMLMKRERLMKQRQLLDSAIQESQMLKLKLNFSPRLSAPCAIDSCVDKSHCQSFDFEGIHEEEVAGKKVAELRQVLDDLEGKAAKLSQSFLHYCEKNEQPNHANPILFVSDLVKKKACCRSTRLDMKLWDIDNLDIGKHHLTIVLNYVGFIIQRFTINVGPVSSIVISNKLNDSNIIKRFPYMDICTAFAFVLNANTTTRKYVSSLSFIQETQTTSSVLGNLLDVAEELQAASVELLNITHTNFHSPSVEQLQLDLHFMDFKSGRMAALSLGMSCLKWGIYPFDAIPYPLKGSPEVSRKSLPEHHLAEIRDAVQSLRVGYSRIIRICRCVSELVQARSG